MGIKKFLLNDKKIEKDSYLWNMIGSILMAFQSVVMLIILTRTVGLVEAGVFTIAYANANLFLTIGKYGMRYFQVSDVNCQFNFGEYLATRFITSTMMMFVSISYVVYVGINNDYSDEKKMVILWMCLFKMVDAVEDVFHGYYQKNNRLDVAAKAMTLRLGSTIIVFCVGMIILMDMLSALMIATIFTLGIFIIFTIWISNDFGFYEEKVKIKNVIILLKKCFPLFIGSFLSFYIGNAPKYAIDDVLNDELQACYGFIAMPVFVVGLLNGFIFNPVLYQMSVMWNKREIKKFVKRIFLQIMVLIGITVVCMLGAFLGGIPILSVLYNTDLSQYKSELLILLLGGGFLGISGFLNTIITVIRFQNSIMWGYAIVALLAYIYSKRVVEQYIMCGAAVLYTILMGILCIIFGGLLAWGIIKSKN